MKKLIKISVLFSLLCASIVRAAAEISPEQNIKRNNDAGLAAHTKLQEPSYAQKQAIALRNSLEKVTGIKNQGYIDSIAGTKGLDFSEDKYSKIINKPSENGLRLRQITTKSDGNTISSYVDETGQDVDKDKNGVLRVHLDKDGTVRGVTKRGESNNKIYEDYTSQANNKSEINLGAEQNIQNIENSQQEQVTEKRSGSLNLTNLENDDQIKAQQSEANLQLETKSQTDAQKNAMEKAKAINAPISRIQPNVILYNQEPQQTDASTVQNIISDIQQFQTTKPGTPITKKVLIKEYNNQIKNLQKIDGLTTFKTSESASLNAKIKILNDNPQWVNKAAANIENTQKNDAEKAIEGAVAYNQQGSLVTGKQANPNFSKADLLEVRKQDLLNEMNTPSPDSGVIASYLKQIEILESDPTVKVAQKIRK